MSNQKFQNSLNRVPQKTPPVWMMRQAGRYHDHYQKLRAQHSFIELCKNPKLAAEVAMGPIEDFDFDVAILFSDLLFPLEAMGMGLKYEPAPELDWYIQSSKDILKLKTVDEAIPQLFFQKEAVELTRKRLPENKSLIGFVGSPWTLFVYAVAGSHKGHLIEVKQMMDIFPSFCEVIMPILKKNIQLQLDGGAEVVMLFDTAAGELSPAMYQNNIEPQIKNLISSFPGKLGYYTKGTVYDHLVGFEGFDKLAGLGFDHRYSLKNCFSVFPGFIQGNFDQTLLFLKPNDFEREFRSFLKEFQNLSEVERAGWVCGLGHGVLPQTPTENVRRFVSIVREIFS
ncbi:MAG: uroporphyrinogen decarboxylase [Bdellovibrionales bacterium]|nr:uroporphyrinogen decarboxylase [Bdellovibrionales bacterium]